MILASINQTLAAEYGLRPLQDLEPNYLFTR
jgi:hypothetical protein